MNISQENNTFMRKIGFMHSEAWNDSALGKWNKDGDSLHIPWQES